MMPAQLSPSACSPTSSDVFAVQGKSRVRQVQLGQADLGGVFVGSRIPERVKVPLIGFIVFCCCVGGMHTQKPEAQPSPGSWFISVERIS
jgi:hypothetical protein